MDKKNEQKLMNSKKRQGWLAAAIGLLFVAICVTIALLASILKSHISSDEDAIALVPSYVEDATNKTTETDDEISAVASTEEDEVDNESQTSNGTNGSSGTAQTSIGFIEEVVNKQLNPDITVHDDVHTWETETKVDVFKIAYENDEAVVNVDGMGDKVIAPGTGNEYTFYLKNTGNVMLDYTLEIEAFFIPDTQPIQVEARLKGYDGTYLLGDEDSWADVLELNQVKDVASISVNRYAYYTLEWQWPYESGDDAYDTLLGNLAVDEDLTLTIVIKTVATGEDIETEFVKVPKVTTGDNAMFSLWVVLFAGAAVLLLLLVIKRKRQKKEQEELDEKN